MDAITEREIECLTMGDIVNESIYGRRVWSAEEGGRKVELRRGKTSDGIVTWCILIDGNFAYGVQADEPSEAARIAWRETMRVVKLARQEGNEIYRYRLSNSRVIQNGR